MKCHLSLNPSGAHPNDISEEFVYMHSSAFKIMFGQPKCKVTDPDTLAGYVKISFKGKCVYRKYRSYSPLNGDEAQVDYLTMCQLGCPALSDEVTIEPSCFWCYQWNTMNKYLKLVFIITLCSLAFSIIGLFL